MRLVTTLLTACLVLSATVSAEAQNGRGNRNGGQNRSAYCPIYSTSYPVQELDSREAALLLFMREEEKLAMDVYQALSRKYPLRIFSTIASSEKRHFDAIGALITRYDLSDPAMPTPGAFSNADLQALYDRLVAQGQSSLTDALQVGVTIEEKDIDDLKDAISNTDNRDVLTVYGNLMIGSSNHLSAFNSHLQVTYSK